MKAFHTLNHITCRTLAFVCAFCFVVCCRTSGTKDSFVPETKKTLAVHAVNINTASSEELEKIPHIGAKIAEKIISHRTANGPFRKVEHLMLVDGISDQRFRQIREFVRVE